jgi:hypothetical protein
MTKYIVLLLMLVILAAGSVCGQDETRLKVSATTNNGDRINGYLKLKSLPPYLTVYYNSNDSILLNTQLLTSASFRIYNQSESTSDRNDRNPFI